MREVSYRHWIARGLARALLADSHAPGARSVAALHARCVQALGQDAPWLKALVEPLAAMAEPSWQKLQVPGLAQRLESADAFGLAFADGHKPVIRRLFLRPAGMLARPVGLKACDVPELASLGLLAQWLNLSIDQLAWLAPERTCGADHYRYQLQAKHWVACACWKSPRHSLNGCKARFLWGCYSRCQCTRQRTVLYPGALCSAMRGPMWAKRW